MALWEAEIYFLLYAVLPKGDSTSVNLYSIFVSGDVWLSKPAMSI